MTKKQMFGIAAGAFLIAGCGTVNPRTVPQTARDLETYTPVAHRPAPDGQYRIAIKTSVNKDNKVLVTALKQTDLQRQKFLLALDTDTRHDMSRELELIPYGIEQMDTSLNQNFANLGWFETVDRKNGVALIQEAIVAEETDPDKIAAADLVLIADSHLSWIADQGWKTTSSASKARGVMIKTDFKLLDVRAKQPILVKQMTSRVVDCGKGRGLLKEAIQKCCDQNAAKFARVVAGKFLPETPVKETRGGGRYALVGLGHNYQAEPEVSSWKWWPYALLPLCYIKTVDVPATRIDFCYTEKGAGPEGKAKLDSVNFAYGKVIEADNKTAWVEVADYETAGVKKGHSAVVSDRTLDGQEIQ